MSEPAKSFEDLVIWQKAHQLVLDIYKFTGTFPEEEKFGLISQLRRSAVSIPANIAEGFGKRGSKDKVRYLNIAQGSLAETRYYLILSVDLNYGNSIHLKLQADEVGKLLNGYIKAIRKNNIS